MRLTITTTIDVDSADENAAINMDSFITAAEELVGNYVEHTLAMDAAQMFDVPLLTIKHRFTEVE